MSLRHLVRDALDGTARLAIGAYGAWAAWQRFGTFSAMSSSRGPGAAEPGARRSARCRGGLGFAAALSGTSAAGLGLRSRRQWKLYFLPLVMPVGWPCLSCFVLALLAFSVLTACFCC